MAERVARARARRLGIVDAARRHLHRLHRVVVERRQPVFEALQHLRGGELRDEVALGWLVERGALGPRAGPDGARWRRRRLPDPSLERGARGRGPGRFRA